MSKKSFGAGTLLSPVPVVMATTGDMDGDSNIITIAWTGIVNSQPPMTYISVRPERHSYKMLEECGEFVINLVTKDLAKATDFCGVKSGKDMDKWKEAGLTKEKCTYVKCPQIKESPFSLECKVVEKKELGSHHMFLAEIVGINADEKIVDENNRICLDEAGLICYAHGQYFEVAKESLGRFGFSVMKEKTKKRLEKEARKNNRNKFKGYKKKK